MTDSLYQTIDGRRVKRKQVLGKEFGEEYFVDDRRFLVHHVNGYWIVKAMLPKGFSGGTLVTIIDSESGITYKSLVWK